jgi:hypothetical protein
MKKSAKITTKELEDRFDKGENVLQFFDTANAEVEDPKTHRVNVDFPEWAVRRLDDEASRLAISRQSLIKLIISDALVSGDPRGQFVDVAPRRQVAEEWNALRAAQATPFLRTDAWFGERWSAKHRPANVADLVKVLAATLRDLTTRQLETENRITELVMEFKKKK